MVNIIYANQGQNARAGSDILRMAMAYNVDQRQKQLFQRQMDAPENAAKLTELWNQKAMEKPIAEKMDFAGDQAKDVAGVMAGMLTGNPALALSQAVDLSRSTRNAGFSALTSVEAGKDYPDLMRDPELVRILNELPPESRGQFLDMQLQMDESRAAEARRNKIARNVQSMVSQGMIDQQEAELILFQANADPNKAAAALDSAMQSAVDNRHRISQVGALQQHMMGVKQQMLGSGGFWTNRMEYIMSLTNLAMDPQSDMDAQYINNMFEEAFGSADAASRSSEGTFGMADDDPMINRVWRSPNNMTGARAAMGGVGPTGPMPVGPEAGLDSGASLVDALEGNIVDPTADAETPVDGGTFEQKLQAEKEAAGKSPARRWFESVTGFGTPGSSRGDAAKASARGGGKRPESPSPEGQDLMSQSPEGRAAENLSEFEGIALQMQQALSKPSSGSSWWQNDGQRRRLERELKGMKIAAGIDTPELEAAWDKYVKAVQKAEAAQDGMEKSRLRAVATQAKQKLDALRGE